MVFRSSLLALAATGLLVGLVGAQEPSGDDPAGPGRILVRALDGESSDPVEAVEVRLPEAGIPGAVTDAKGRAEFRDVPRGIYEVELRHFAYGEVSRLVNVPARRTVEIDVRLQPRVIGVEPLVVEVKLRPRGLERQGFYQRQRLRHGYFYAPEEVERKPFIGMLREVPHLRFGSGRSAFRHYPYFRRGARNCSPAIWVDGMQIPLRGMAIEDMVPRSNVLAMEIYRPGSTPGQYITVSGVVDCGAIVVWTRLQER